MLKSIVNRVFGTRHERERRRVQPIVDAINEQFERLQGVSEEELRGQTAKFRETLRERTAELEARIAELKTAKHATADAAERERPPDREQHARAGDHDQHDRGQRERQQVLEWDHDVTLVPGSADPKSRLSPAGACA